MRRAKQLPGESTRDYLARFSGLLANAALVARERGDPVNALLFAIKAAETLALAKALGWDGRDALSPAPSPMTGGRDQDAAFGTGSRADAPSPSVSAASGFDPSRTTPST